MGRDPAAPPKGYVIDRTKLPKAFPTHTHAPAFWECLGRAVATFGFLEQMLGKAIYRLSGSREAPESEADRKAALEEWMKKLEKALVDPLGPLIDRFGKEVREHPKSRFETKSLDGLLTQLREAAKVRNVICHGSWQKPNERGASVPFFVNRRLEVFASEVDCAWLDQLQQHTAELVCEVTDAVTHMGVWFPGSKRPRPRRPKAAATSSLTKAKRSRRRQPKGGRPASSLTNAERARRRQPKPAATSSLRRRRPPR